MSDWQVARQQGDEDPEPRLPVLPEPLVSLSNDGQPAEDPGDGEEQGQESPDDPKAHPDR